MTVKIGDQIFTSDDVPIMLLLSTSEKQLIADMGEQCKFCSFPIGTSVKDMEKFMGID